MTDVTVNTKDLRQALAAVVAHTSPDPELDTFHRVRFVVGPVNVEVYATQGYTAGLSIVSVVDHGDGEAGQWDMPPAAVKDLLALFKVSKDVEEEACLQFVVDGEHVTVTDVSGLFPGKSVTLPRLPDHDYYPDVPGLLGQTRAMGTGQLNGPVATSGPWWATFVAATRAYGGPLLITAAMSSGRARLLVNVGESFIGVLTASADEDHIARVSADRDAWADRLPSAPRWTRTEAETEPADDGRHLTVVDDEDGDD